MRSIEATGKSVDAAIFNGLQQLGISIDEVSIEILQTETKGILGIGAKPAKVRLTEKPAEEVLIPDFEAERERERREKQERRREQGFDRDRRARGEERQRRNRDDNRPSNGEAVRDERRRAEGNRPESVRTDDRPRNAARAEKRMANSEVEPSETQPTAAKAPAQEGTVPDSVGQSLKQSNMGSPNAENDTAEKPADPKRNSSRRNERGEYRERVNRPERAERTERAAERPERTERTERAAERPERIERTERAAERPERTERTERVTERTDRDERHEGHEKVILEPAAEVNYTEEDTIDNPAADFVKGLVARMGIEAKVLAAKEEGAVRLRIDSEVMGVLIGHRGETLDAIQYLTSLVINRNRKTEGYTRVTINTEDYREKREETLIRLARRVASQVKATGRARVLEPMNPYERRILHAALQNNPNVTTHSEGEEPNRRVVVTPRRRYTRRNNDAN